MERHDPNDQTRPDEQPTEPDDQTPDEQPTEPDAQALPSREEVPRFGGPPGGDAPPVPPGGTPPPGEPPPQGDGGFPPGGGGHPRPAPGAAPPPPPSGPRRLHRSRTDRVLGGVCAGLAEYLRVDPIIVRIVFLVLVFVGGISVIAYLAMLLLVPSEPVGGPMAAGDPAAAPGGERGRTLTIVAVVVLLLVGWPLLLGGGLALAALAVPLVLLVLAGLLAWWVVSGEGPNGGAGDLARRSALGVAVLVACGALFVGGAWAAGVGGGAIAAGLVIAAGVALVAGAFLGRVRFLILPAVAVALGVSVMAAADIDLGGGYGERSYAPASSAELSDGYQLGAGQLVVDLRGTELPRGDTPLDMRIGIGEAVLVVPEDVCVATNASVGAGNVSSFGRDNDGVDLEWDDAPSARAGSSRLLLDAEVGVGQLRVQHEPYRGHDDRGPFDGDGSSDRSDPSTGNTHRVNAGCTPVATTTEAGA